MAARRAMFAADWNDALFIHFRVDPNALSRVVPFDLDTRDGDAFVSLVAFTQSNLRPAFGGKLAAMLSAPLATHEFLNLRAYVRVNGEPAIYFISEWIPNKLAVLIGPRLYGLPYRLGAFCGARRGSRPSPSSSVSSRAYSRGIWPELAGKIPRGVPLGMTPPASEYHNRNRVVAQSGVLEYRTSVTRSANILPAKSSSLDHFFVERYVAYTYRNGVARRFRVTHDPWLQTRAKVELLDRSLLDSVGLWARNAELIGANCSPGVRDVGISAPQKCAPRLRLLE